MKQLFARLISNMGLTLLAMFTIGIWTSNIQDFFSTINASKSTLEAYEQARAALTDEDRQRLWGQEPPPAPAPTPRKSAEETLGVTPSGKQKRKYDDIEQVLGLRPSDAGRSLSAEEFLRRKREAQQPQTIEEALSRPVVKDQQSIRQRLWQLRLTKLGRRVKAAYPGAYDDIPDEELGRKVKAKYPGALAICNDDMASYSQTRSGTCSYHGGVKVWLSFLDHP